MVQLRVPQTLTKSNCVADSEERRVPLLQRPCVFGSVFGTAVADSTGLDAPAVAWWKQIKGWLGRRLPATEPSENTTLPWIASILSEASALE